MNCSKSFPDGVVSGDNVFVDENVVIAPTVRIQGSVKGTKISIGAHSEIYDYVVIRAVGGEGDVNVGEYCYFNPGSVLYSGNGITLGDYVLVAAGVKIMPTNHNYSSRDLPIRHQGFAPSKGGVVIEDDVWLGANAVILDGARIGRGAIIAAGSVVGGTVPPYEVWGGIPAVKIRDRPE